MIKINLVPIEELENPHWYLPEVMTMVLTVMISWFAVQAYLDGIREDIDNFSTDTANLEMSYKTILKETVRYDQLDKDISDLKDKLDSLRKITTSKIERFKPVILFEHLQNLKPEGLWFNYLADNSSGNTIALVGKAFDSLLIADFMAAIDATKNQVYDSSDLRTQVYFSNVNLERVSTQGAESRGASTSPVAQTIQSATQFWTVSDSDFPELKEFPSFQLTLTYAERKQESEPVILSGQ